MTDLTKDQEFVFDSVLKKIYNSKKYFNPSFNYTTIGGYAGTGKTFLISLLRKELSRKNIAFCAFTGKASSVLKNKLIENDSFYSKDFVGTIHSLIYIPEVKFDKKTKKLVITKWIKKESLDFDLIFVDEASMINVSLWNDLLSYKIPIIAVGDHGQLPPIGDQFNLMSNPEYILNEVKRQALENPIIRLTQDVRNGKEIPYGFYDKSNNGVFKLPWNSQECKTLFDKLDFTSDDIVILCGLNKTRVMINQMIRDRLGFSQKEPYPGEKIIFLKNNYISKVFNGTVGKNLFLLYEAPNVYKMTILLEGYEQPYTGLVYDGCFGKEQYSNESEKIQEHKYKKIIKDSGHSSIDLCDYGYCLSVHKSQGSEFKKVVVFQERSYYWDDEYMKKWLYTASSRAKEKLFIIE